MIYKSEPIVNIANSGKDIILFLRGEDGKLLTKRISDFLPFYYEKDETGTFTSYDGCKLRKVICSHPKDIYLNKTENSYLSDIKHTTNYLINRVDKFQKTIIKYLFIDIEIIAEELPETNSTPYPISCITVYNSLHKNIQTWYVGDQDYNTLEEKEIAIIKALINYIRKESPDIIFGWNVSFDYNYLYNRSKKLNINFAKEISPINYTRGGEERDIYYPAGISILDYMKLFKKVYMREASYTLDYICQKHLGEAGWQHTDFSKLSSDIKDKNINDVKRMVKLETKFRLISYYDEIRIMTKCQWEDLYHNSRLVEYLLLEEAKKQNVILPNKQTLGEDDDVSFQGAIRDTEAMGLYKEISKNDLGCYSEDTEILTEQGWKFYHQLKIGENVASFNINKNEIEFQSLNFIHKYEVKDIEMYNFKNFYTNQLITDKHKVLYKYTRNNNYKTLDEKTEWNICFPSFIKKQHYALPISGIMKDRIEFEISDELIKIYAWIISEGYNRKKKDSQNNSYSFCQSRTIHSNFCDEINNLFIKLGWNVKENTKKRYKNNKISLESDWNLNVNLSKHINLENNYKVIPLWMLQKLSIRQLNVLFEELMKGDGSKAQHIYFAKDNLARDRFQTLCVLLGKSTYKNNRKEVYFRENKFTVIHHKIKKIKYSGIVWCPTVKNGFVLVRREGRTFISGNSAYPSMIVNFCLDSQNINFKEGIIINGIKFKQNKKALLPLITTKVLKLKDDLKKEKKLNPTDKLLAVKYDAIKAIINSVFGVTGSPYFRLYDSRVASSITFLVRDLLTYVKDKIENEGSRVIYYDTDSVFINNKEDISDKLNGIIDNWAIQKYDKEDINLKFEYEGYFDKLFILGKCLIEDTLITTEEGEVYDIKDLKKGNIYFGKKINCFSERIVNNLNHITTTDGKLDCTDEHIHVVYRGNRHYFEESKIENIETKYLKKGDYLLTPQNIPHKEKYKWTPEQLAFISMIIADGHLSKYSISLKWNKNKSFIKAKEITLKAIHLFNVKISSLNISEKEKSIKIFGKNFVDYISNTFEIPIGNKRYTSTISNQIFSSSLKSIESFIDTIIFFEGWSHNITNKKYIETKSKKFLFRFQLLLKKLDIQSTISSFKRKNMTVDYRLSIKTKKRKINYFQNKKIFLSKVISIKKYSKQNSKVYDYSTETHYFLANNLITHNCHYYGYLNNREDPEIKGVEIKRSSSSKYEAKFQEELINHILNDNKREDILNWIENETLRIKSLPLDEVAFPCKLKTQKYVNYPIFMRAYDNTRKILKTFKIPKGELFYYIFTNNTMEVVAFNKELQDKIVKRGDVDWDKVIDRNIYSKVEKIFKALNWFLPKNISQLQLL